MNTLHNRFQQFRTPSGDSDAGKAAGVGAV